MHKHAICVAVQTDHKQLVFMTTKLDATVYEIRIRNLFLSG